MYTETESLAIVIVSIPIVVLNIAEFVVLSKEKKNLKNHERILRSLAVADFLVGGVLIYGYSKQIIRIQHGINKDVDRSTNAGIWFSIFSSILHVFGLTLDRGIAIQYPFKHKRWVTKKRTNVFLALIWLSCSVVIPVAFLCPETNTVQLVFSYLALCFSVIIIGIYIMIVRRAMASRKFVKTGGIVSSNGKKNKQSEKTKREHRLMFMCLVISMSFAVSVTPFACLTIANIKFVVYSCLMLVGNSLINPAIFFYMKCRARSRKEYVSS
eukprot:gene418-1055_t